MGVTTLSTGPMVGVCGEPGAGLGLGQTVNMTWGVEIERKKRWAKVTVSG